MPTRTGLAEGAPHRLERRLGDVVVVAACGLDVQGEAALDGEALERVREQRQREPADAIAGERERDLGMRAADEVDRRGRARLVHRDRRGPYRVDADAAVERLPDRVAERGEHVLDRVVLVDLEVAARQQLEVEPAVEGEQRQQVVEEADAGLDSRAAAAVELERDAQRRLGRRADDQRRAARRRPGRGAERARGGGRSRPAGAP